MVQLGTIVLFGLLGLIFLVEILEQIVAAVRERLAPEEELASPTYSAGFSLRRPDSALRERYRKVHARDQTSEYCKYKDDPHDV